MGALAGGIHLTWTENRALRVALLASIALHLLLLYALPDLRQARRASIPREPLIARMLQPQSPAEPVAPAAPAIEEARKLEKKPTGRPSPRANPLSQPEPPAPTQPVSSPTDDLRRAEPVVTPAQTAAPSAAPDVAAPLVARVPGTQSPVPAVTSLPVSPALAAKGVVQSTSSPGDTLDPGTLAQYRLAIISAARRYKRYPRAALDNNWQGRVEIRMVVGPNGAISELSVRSSAGHQVLDQQALEMIERAKTMTQLPASLRGREFAVDIPVIFSLRDADV